jgi:hypothetical protein
LENYKRSDGEKIRLLARENSRYGARVILINACLSSIPLYILSFYKLHVGVDNRFIIFRNRLLWQEEQDMRKCHLVDWETMCTPKDLGGPGVLNLDLMNISLLCKWLWKLENDEGMWQDILKKRYLVVTSPFKDDAPCAFQC